MDLGKNDAIPDITDAIRARLVTQWEAWKNQDTASNDAVIADEFDSFCPDGTRRVGKPTAEQMAAEPIAGYKLSEFRAVPLGADAALVTYFAHVSLPNDETEYPMAVGEFWVKRSGEWFIRGFSGTLMK
ncbi:MAG: nuclear transport factor 2 family protein [Terriglobia bacterium]|jgi:hypothetical protein